MSFIEPDLAFQSCAATGRPAVPLLCYTRAGFSSGGDRQDRSENDGQDDTVLHEVRIIDNDYNTYREVMDIVKLALGLTEQQAYAVAWEVDHLGYCVVAEAPELEAEALARIIRTIGIEVQVNPLSAAQV
jgi:ATP-dependent Clp protease adapter protein ClpS